jgi:hypothetical protein
MAEPSAASVNNPKNAVAATAPNGIRANAIAKVVNTSPGPPDGLRFSANTSGNTAKPAMNEIAVSLTTVNRATCRKSICGPA